LIVITLTGKLTVSWKKNKGRNKTNTIDLDKHTNPVEIRQYMTKIVEKLRNKNKKIENESDYHETKLINIKHSRKSQNITQIQ